MFQPIFVFFKPIKICSNKIDAMLHYLNEYLLKLTFKFNRPRFCNQNRHVSIQNIVKIPLREFHRHNQHQLF